MTKLYRYTIYKQDGTKQQLAMSGERDFAELRLLLNCQTIELVPNSYLPDELARKDGITAYGDEGGRFNSENTRNPHFKVLHGNVEAGEPQEWDVVGNIIVEEKLYA